MVLRIKNKKKIKRRYVFTFDIRSSYTSVITILRRVTFKAHQDMRY